MEHILNLKLSDLLDGKTLQSNTGENIKVNWLKDSTNKRQDIILALESSSKNSISVPNIAKEFDVSRQYVYDILKEFPIFKDKIKRKKRTIKTTTISARILQFVDNFNGNPTVKEIADGVGTTSNYVFTVLNKNKEYKEKVLIEKRESRKTSNQEIIDFINSQENPITISDVASHFNEKYNVIHGVISRNSSLIRDGMILYKK